MGSLKCLRYLDVSGSHFEVLPEFITKLSNLRTLKLEDCSYIRELPEDLHQLINLRHLVLSDHGKWNEMPRGIEHLTQLQTLPVFKVARYNGGTSRSSIWELGYLKLLEGNLHISNLQNVTEAADAQKANLQGKQNIGSLMLEWSCRGNVNECTNDSTVMEQLQPNPSLMTVEKCPKLERSHDLTFIRGFFPWLKEYKLDGVMKIRIPYKRYATFN
ncbi:hypothetical protein C5167_048778 [Papaver somniferum]|uniref:Disease resistance R13L4/SHOC-2-like LRR domain-containing protein n=1 Tax=Papaver somniferum TaxID=3469 RepID=A0A4Y7KLM6_PAPSO|nr:hypothetical protein C5167_048778 [Papaver somniferum]